MMRRAMVPALLLLSACHHRRAPASLIAACDTVAAQPATQFDPSMMNGGYRVTFIATGGLRSGHAAIGRMMLRPQDASLLTIEPHDGVEVTQPVIGQLDLAIDSVGAVRMGDLMAADAAMPGLAFYVTHRPGGEVSGIIGRVGSVSNARGPAPIDAGHFTLFVRQVTPNGIWGGWTSNPGTGGLITPDAAGHFCALRS